MSRIIPNYRISLSASRASTASPVRQRFKSRITFGADALAELRLARIVPYLLGFLDHPLHEALFDEPGGDAVALDGRVDEGRFQPDDGLDVVFMLAYIL